MGKPHKAETTWKAILADIGGKAPPLSEQEAVAAARKLWRHEYGKTLTARVQITSGNRNNWLRRGVLYVNPDGGWWNLIHDLSHLIHYRLNPNDRPHSRAQEVRE